MNPFCNHEALDGLGFCRDCGADIGAPLSSFPTEPEAPRLALIKAVPIDVDKQRQQADRVTLIRQMLGRAEAGEVSGLVGVYIWRGDFVMFRSAGVSLLEAVAYAQMLSDTNIRAFRQETSS